MTRKAKRATKTADTAGRTPRGEQVYLKLRDEIHAGKLKPGEKVRETEVANWYGVSRTPVREALRRLESDGLLVFAPWRGVVVAELDQQQVIELYAMRQVLEGTAARLAAQHAAESEIDALRALLEREANVGDDFEKMAAFNRQLHQALYSAAHNRYLLGALNALRDSLALLRSTTYSNPGRIAAGHREHIAIIEAIARRDADSADTAARKHIASAERLRLRMLIEGS